MPGEAPQLRERVLGSLFGAAVGDALGVPVEFSDRAALERNPVTGLRAYGTHSQPAGTWSDDTSMALCLAESIVSVDWDLEDQAARYARWAFEDYMTPHGVTFDIGNTTRAALQRYRHGTPARRCGGTAEQDNGNGGLMRILPAALYCAGAPVDALVQGLSDATALTHAHARSRLASVYFGLLVRELLQAVTAAAAVRETARLLRELATGGSLPETLTAELPSLSRMVDRDPAALPRHEINSGGYVIDTLEASVWCLLTTGSYRDCVLEAVNLGGDTDTTGTVAGALAGLQWGLPSIPSDWLAALVQREELEALYQKITDVVVRRITDTPAR